MESRGLDRVDEEKRGLRSDVDGLNTEETLSSNLTISSRRRKKDTVRSISIAFNLVLVSILLFVALSKYTHSHDGNKYSISPQMKTHYTPFDYSESAYDALEYFSFHRQQRVLDSWEDILSTTNLYFTPDEVAKSGAFEPGQDLKRPVILPNGTYFGSLYVYHHLHCIKNIYWSLFKEEYEEEISDMTHAFEKQHLLHCLDWLRQAVTCNPDMTPLYYTWYDSQKMPGFESVENHQCTNWGDVVSWSKDRMFDPFVPGLVTHPKYGYPYGDEGDESEDALHRFGV